MILAKLAVVKPRSRAAAPEVPRVALPGGARDVPQGTAAERRVLREAPRNGPAAAERRPVLLAPQFGRRALGDKDGTAAIEYANEVDANLRKPQAKRVSGS
jgi:hypothetical protein